MNGKAFNSTAAWKPKYDFVFKKRSKLNFTFILSYAEVLPREKKNHLSFVNISLVVVIDTCMESSSRVLQH